MTEYFARPARSGRSGRFATAVSACALLAACGGGGSSSSGGGASVSFASASSVTTTENAGGAFYTATATATGGAAVTFSIEGGPDAARFAITPNGQLRFVQAPNFELPTDHDGDNVYQVSLAASAGTAHAAQTVAVTVANAREGIAVHRLATNFGSDAVVTANSRRSGLVVVGADGRIREVDATSGATSERGNAFEAGETGRVMAVGHLNHYVVVMLDIAGRGVFVRSIPLLDAGWQYRDEFQLAAPSTLAPAGALATGGDGLLWGAIGDSTGTFAQDGVTGYGKLFRVQAAGCGASMLTYCVWAEMFGDGVHAPAGVSAYNRQTILFDRGASRMEEVNFFNQDARPLDFGWPYREGAVELTTNPPAAVNGPSVTYERGDGSYLGKGVVGGGVYAGPIAELSGRLIFGDVSGKVFAVPASYLADGILHGRTQIENRTEDFKPDAGTIDRPVAFLSDQSGRFFVLDGDGELFAVDPA